TLPELLNLERLRAELKASGVEGIARTYREALRFADLDRQQTIEEAAFPVLTEILETPPSKLAARREQLGGRPNDADLEKATARRLLAEFERAKVDRMPAFVAVGEQALELLRVTYRYLCGPDPSLMTSAEFARRYLAQPFTVGGGFDVDPTWPVRRIEIGA